MELVTIRHDPLGIWVRDHPVIIPFLDSVLAPEPDCFELAEEWSTDLYRFEFVRDQQFMVYLPQNVRKTVEWCGRYLELC